jgi:hypothetical protein
MEYVSMAMTPESQLVVSKSYRLPPPDSQRGLTDEAIYFSRHPELFVEETGVQRTWKADVLHALAGKPSNGPATLPPRHAILAFPSLNLSDIDGFDLHRILLEVAEKSSVTIMLCYVQKRIGPDGTAIYREHGDAICYGTPGKSGIFMHLWLNTQEFFELFRRKHQNPWSVIYEAQMGLINTTGTYTEDFGATFSGGILSPRAALANKRLTVSVGAPTALSR